MKNWIQFVAGESVDIECDHPMSKDIVKCIGNNLASSFLKIARGERTEYVMDSLSMLGRKFGFKSMSTGISTKAEEVGLKKIEWLYDLHWYDEKEPTCYSQTSLPLVVECEWDYKRKGDRDNDNYSAIKWDFQKLLVANADLRALIFKARSSGSAEEENAKLDKYFDDTIKGYKNLADGSHFLFIAFNNLGFRYINKSNALI